MSSRIEVPQPRAINRAKLNYLSATKVAVSEPAKIDMTQVTHQPSSAVHVPKPIAINRTQVEDKRPKLSVLEQNVHSAITPGSKNFPPFEVTAELEQKSNQRIAQYPADQRRSAVLPLLHEVQHHFGFISPESIEWVAGKLEISPIKVVEVVTFYPGFRQKAPGKFHVRVCRTLSCAMAGSAELMEKLCELTGIDRSGADTHTDPIAVSPCGNYSVEFAECLASCGTAPVCLVNDDFHEGITEDKAKALLDRYASKA
ncbi:MAG: NAD(P)H-dependent oxidoreductase subunit E [Akkermansiaceae bacterium]